MTLRADTNKAGIRGIFSSHILRFLSIFRTNEAGFVHRGLVPMKLVLVLVIAARGFVPTKMVLILRISNRNANQRSWYLLAVRGVYYDTNIAGTLFLHLNTNEPGIAW